MSSAPAAGGNASELESIQEKVDAALALKNYPLASKYVNALRQVKELNEQRARLEAAVKTAMAELDIEQADGQIKELATLKRAKVEMLEALPDLATAPAEERSEHRLSVRVNSANNNPARGSPRNRPGLTTREKTAVIGGNTWTRLSWRAAGRRAWRDLDDRAVRITYICVVSLLVVTLGMLLLTRALTARHRSAFEGRIRTLVALEVVPEVSGCGETGPPDVMSLANINHMCETVGSEWTVEIHNDFSGCPEQTQTDHILRTWREATAEERAAMYCYPHKWCRQLEKNEDPRWESELMYNNLVNYEKLENRATDYCGFALQRYTTKPCYRRSSKERMSPDVAPYVVSTPDRLKVVRLAIESWGGPFSLAVMIRHDHRNEDLKAVNALWHWAEGATDAAVDIALLFDRPGCTDCRREPMNGDGYFPINTLRNLALNITNAEYVFSLEADFTPAPQTRDLALRHMNALDNKVAIVVPAFEILCPTKEIQYPDDCVSLSSSEGDAACREKLDSAGNGYGKRSKVCQSGGQCVYRHAGPPVCQSEMDLAEPYRVPTTKAELVSGYWSKHHAVAGMAAQRDAVYSTFHENWEYGHRGDQYDLWFRWNDSDKLIPTQYSRIWEPWVIAKKDEHFPLYNERFRGHFLNKVQQIDELNAAGYRFKVLPEAFLVHHFHVQSTPGWDKTNKQEEKHLWLKKWYYYVVWGMPGNNLRAVWEQWYSQNSCPPRSNRVFNEMQFPPELEPAVDWPNEPPN